MKKMFLSIFLALSSFVKFAAPKLERDEWNDLNNNLKSKLNPINFHLSRATNPEDIVTLGDQANIVIREFLLEHPEVFEATETGNNSKYTKHQPKSIEEATKLKKHLKKIANGQNATENDRKRFRLALRAISDLKKAQKRLDSAKTAKHQESLYLKNKWPFAKKAVKGTLDSKPEPPGFTKVQADQFYPETYSNPKIIDPTKLNWFPNLPVTPADDNYQSFNMEPIRPRDVKQTLKNCNKNSSPGPDGIPYSILYKLPCTHHTLATLYNKVLQTGYPPKSWSESVVKLIHKSGPLKNTVKF
jgi:hypothetical protein